MATLNLPSWGIRIYWKKHKKKLVPNKWRGKTTFVAYEITGQEAIWTTNLIDWVNTLSTMGVVISAKARDVENHTPWANIPIHDYTEDWQKTLIGISGDNVN